MRCQKLSSSIGKSLPVVAAVVVASVAFAIGKTSEHFFLPRPQLSPELPYKLSFNFVVVGAVAAVVRYALASAGKIRSSARVSQQGDAAVNVAVAIEVAS